MNRTTSGPPRKNTGAFVHLAGSSRGSSRRKWRTEPQFTQHNTTLVTGHNAASVQHTVVPAAAGNYRATPPVGSHPHHQEEARPEHLTHLVPISQRWEEGLGLIRSNNSTPSNVHRLRCKRKRVTPEDLKTIEGRSRPLGEHLRV